MSWKPTILVLVLAAASIAAAWLTRGQGALGRGNEATVLRVFENGEIPVDDVSRVTLVRGGQPPMVFSRDGAAWRQAQPVAWNMDPFSIRRFAVDSDAMLATATIDAAADEVGSFGFDPPQAVLTLSWDGGEASLEFGRRTLGGRAYVRHAGGSTVYVVDQSLHDRAVEMEPKEWRSRRLFEHAGIDSTRVALNMIPADDGMDQSFELTRNERRRWILLRPIRTRLNAEQTEAFLAQLQATQLEGFVFDDPADLTLFGLDRPWGRFTVTTPLRTVGEDGVQMREMSETIELGHSQVQGKAVYARREGSNVVFAVGSQTLGLMSAWSSLMDLTGSGVDAADVFGLRISTPRAEFNLKRDAANPQLWRSVDHVNQPASAQAVAQLLEYVTATPATNIVQQQVNPQWEVGYIIFKSSDDRPLDTVQIARNPETGQWLLDNGDTLQRILPASIDIPMQPEAFGLDHQQ